MRKCPSCVSNGDNSLKEVYLKDKMIPDMPYTWACAPCYQAKGHRVPVIKVSAPTEA